MATNKTELPPELVQALQAIEAEASQVVEETNTPEALAEANDLTFTKGRVYVNTGIVEAAARVLNTGTPEVAQTDGGRSTHVILFRTEQGSVAIQNAYKA